MRASRWFLVVIATYLFAFLAHAIYLHKTVYGDGVYYYSWLRSIVIDHDVDFTNEYQALGGSQPDVRSRLLGGSPTRRPGNKYSIGPALFWSPIFLSTCAKLHHPEGETHSHLLGVPLCDLITGFTSVFYAITGLVLLYRLLCQSFSQHIALLATLTIAFATNLLFYGSIDPVNSHALSFFTVVLFLSFLFARKKSWFTIGITLGLIGTVRPQDMIVGLLVRPVKWRPFLAGAVIGFWPQILAWQALYGNPLALPYLRGGERLSFSITNIAGVLFAPSNGLFLWTPATLLGCIGLIRFKKSFAYIVFLQLIIVASWSTWWQGASYSGRMFVGMLPLLAFGIAFILTKIKVNKTPLYLLVGALSSINALLIIYFLISR